MTSKSLRVFVSSSSLRTFQAVLTLSDPAVPCNDHVQVQTAWQEAEAYPSLRKGSMGGQDRKWSSDIFRGDHISFLLPEKERSSGNVGISAVLTALESLQPLLAAQGFPVDGRITFQLACYPVRPLIPPFTLFRKTILISYHHHRCP